MLTDWAIHPQDLAGLVPDCYADFRPIVADGLAMFVRGLSPRRLAELAMAQAALPSDASLETRLVCLLHASPVLHKLGQVVARRRELDPTLREHLQQLESMEPRTRIEEIRPIVLRELSQYEERYRITPTWTPLAEASVAVVLPVFWTDPSNGQRRGGVLKVLKGDVVELLEQDLEILASVADLFDERATSTIGGLPAVRYREVFDEVRELLRGEVQFVQEQQHLRRAAEQFADDPAVQVPATLPFCTPRITAMERVIGRKVTELARRGPLHDRQLFALTVRTLLARPLLTRDGSFLFHGDPHAGNLFATDDGRLALLDWSLAGRLSNRQREQLVDFAMGAVSRDENRIAAAVEALADGPVDQFTVSKTLGTAMREVSFGVIPGPRWVMHCLDDLALSGGVRFPSNLMLFRKAFFTLEGVLGDVCPEASLDAQLLTQAVMSLALEWPLRWLKPFGSRDFDTHVSLADLMAAVMTSPLRATAAAASATREHADRVASFDLTGERW